jgi:hypothetical protein
LSTPLILTSFSVGELTPSLFGRVDQARYHNAASTARNAFVSYRGGLYSRAGTAFVGFSKQTGRSYPHRLITFQFNINQGLALEFGNFYMRVIANGAYVTEAVVPITNITQSSPGVITASATGGNFAVPDNTFTFSSYNSGDQITLAGGVYTSPAVLTVTSTILLGLSTATPATAGEYAPGDTITLAGGTQLSPSVVTVTHTQVASATIASAGSLGADGPATVTGTTGTGTFFQANVTITGGAISSVNSITVPGDYTTNPTTPTAEPVTGGGLIGAALNLTMGVLDFTLTMPGTFSANPSGNMFTQASTSGSGVGATFQFALFGPQTVVFSNPGVYTVFPPNPVQQASTTGSGLGVQFTVSSVSTQPFNNGDWVFLSGIGGMTELNGQTVVVGFATPTSFQIFDVYGNPIDTTGYTPYTAGGDAARIYTVTAPYSEQDLDYLKFTQSADVMSLCCVNPVTSVEYPPYDLTRNSDTNWVFQEVTLQATVLPPATISGVASPPPTTTPPTPTNTFYEYVVTAVNKADGTESIASPIALIPNAVDIAATTGSVKITWSAVPGVSLYNVYKATPGYTFQPPVGALFGFINSSYGTQFLDSGFVPDFDTVPPTHQNPFARGQILQVNPITEGQNWTEATVTINSATGSGAVITPIISETQIVAYLVDDAGQKYQSGDTVTITGDGINARASIVVGAQSGTYPSVVSYFQERRVYANTLNNPDTYFMSQPGSFKNFDSRTPTISSDAITGTPWSFQVNGIQWLVNVPGGVIALTGLSAWLLSGTGGSAVNPQPISPSSQQAQSQTYNGCSETVPPLRIDYDVIYVQAKGSIYRDLSYNFYANVYTGTDITLSSSHLFTNFDIVQHAYCEEPYKIVWSIRSDGNLLSLTYLKPEQVCGWTRHDTNGIFKTLCSVIETVIVAADISQANAKADSLYVGVQRNFPKGMAYTVERMDNRLWDNVENCWCVDCGFELPQPTPNANLDCSTPYGLGSIIGFSDLVGGNGYSPATTATVIDDNGQGPGTGATVNLNIVAGVIVSMTFPSQGQNYTYPQLSISDPANTGSGGSARLTLNNFATFTSSQPIFSPSNIGDVIRMGGGIAEITTFIDNSHVGAQIIDPITAIQPDSINMNNPQGQVQTQLSGTWTLTTPVSHITNLQPLAGMVVTGLADGQVIPPTVVNMDGTLNLSTPASAIIIGLGFQVQIQCTNLDTGEPSVQGQRKKISAATTRIESSLNIKMGSNQIDGSTLNPIEVAPIWENMREVPNKGRAAYNSPRIPLYTGDERLYLPSGYAILGQVAVQQDDPLPLQVLAVVPEVWGGDTPQQNFSPRQKSDKGK